VLAPHKLLVTKAALDAIRKQAARTLGAARPAAAAG